MKEGTNSTGWVKRAGRTDAGYDDQYGMECMHACQHHARARAPSVCG